MIQPVLGTPLAIESVAPVVLALAGACAALWRRGNVIQDRQDAQRTANEQRFYELMERVLEALHEQTDAIREVTRRVG